MTDTTAPASRSTTSTSGPVPGSTVHRQWRRCLAVASVLTIAAATLMMAFGRFIGPSLVVLDLAMLVGLWLLRRPGRAGIVVLALFSLANLLLHGPIVVMQLSLPESPASFVTGLALGLSSVLVCLVAVPAWLRQVGNRHVVTVMVATLAVGLGLALAASLTLFATRVSDSVRPGDLQLTTSGMAVSPHRLHAAAGRVTVAVRNNDSLFPRSFDLDAADVHVLVPPRTTRRITFTIDAGNHPFYDNATATEATSGTLVVEAS